MKIITMFRAVCVTRMLPMLLLFALLIKVQATNAYSTNADGSIYTYSKNADGSSTIVAYAGPPWAVTIPATIHGLPVTSIGYEAFFQNENLTSVIITNSVTSIGDFAFYQCFNLSGITIPNSVTNIGNATFQSCSSLTNITIPNGVTRIGNSTFDSSGLTRITIPDGVITIDNYAFQDCALTSISVPNSVTSIGDDAFDYCESLTNVIIGNGIASIGPSVFENCSSLLSVTLGSGLSNIGDSAFLLCPRLMEFNVSAFNSNYSSYAGVLFNRNQTTLVQCPEGITGAYIVPDSVTSIGNHAFEECNGLTSVTIGKNVGDIENNAFLFCSSLTRVKIPDNVTNIGTAAFANCLILNSVTVGNGVISIGSYAFEQCYGLTSILFCGNAPAPTDDATVFASDSDATVFYLPGTKGWGSTFDSLPTVLWNPRAQIDGPNFGIQTNRFGFNITGTSNLVIVVEDCTNLAYPVWMPVSTNSLNTFIGTNGTSYFSDPQWTNYPRRFYRFRSP